MKTETAYEIPIEMANSVKSLVGKTMIASGKEVKITAWEGVNYIITDVTTGKSGAYPAMYILQQIGKKFTLKN